MPESAQVIDRFQKKMAEAVDHFNELQLAIYGKRRQAALENRLMEQFVMSVAVLWEAFINDLVLAYVSEHPETYLQNLEVRINQSVSEKFGNTTARKVRFLRPRNLNRSQAIAMIDPKGMNITAKSAAILSTKVNTLLIARDARKFSFIAEDGELIDLLICIRNYLGHRSAMSRNVLKSSITNIDSAKINSPLGGVFTTLGPYLRQAAGTSTRATFIAHRLVDISEKLR